MAGRGYRSGPLLDRQANRAGDTARFGVVAAKGVPGERPKHRHWQDPPPALRGDTIEAREFVTREKKQPAFFWRTETPPELGRSGGPLLDAQGRVIGIAIAASGQKGFYAHHDEILAALKRNGFSWLVSQAK